MISISAASKLLDFAGGAEGRRPRLGKDAAKDQLQGAVALHNILESGRFAYLADEVGLGKTYVALGALALFRHFNPAFRVLVIAPKENIQRKWMKELGNFVRNNVRYPDLRVKALHGAPVRPAVYCGNLLELLHETAIDPDRDFFARLTSFGFGLSEDAGQSWERKRDAICRHLPWFPDDLLTLYSKEQFKLNYARAVCCGLPKFDLVIVDEGHNLKAGLQRGAAMRNRLLALTLGNDTEPLAAADRRRLRHYGPRAERVLFLSATPLEDDYRHIWNQLNVFGLAGDRESPLRDRDVSDDVKRGIVSQFMIRRVGALRVNGSTLTKNLYRRQWREGGVELHDEPLPAPGNRQRLIVALVQKKVSELLASGRFNNSFQIGMLASFESFLQTAKLRKSDDEGTFDDADQTQDQIEKQGIDVETLNRLSRQYERKFGHPMPHPKMDALVTKLRAAFDSGRKALVFVRRVASVTDISHKLNVEYDAWLLDRLRTELRAELHERLEELFKQYKNEQVTRASALATSAIEATPDEEELQEEDDGGGNETFFSWFFRGEGPDGVLSGAAIAKRFSLSRFALSSFFADNYVARLLDVQPGERRVFQALLARTKWSADHLQTELERRAGRLIDRKRNPARTTPHLVNFMAFQQAAVEILHECSDAGAAVVLQETLNRRDVGGEPVSLEQWIDRPTFFTQLRNRPELRAAIWPKEASRDFVAEFRRDELRREMLASMFRLGHASIDLYVSIVNRLGSFSPGGEDLDNRTLADDVLALLERQRQFGQFGAFHELREAAANFDLILDTNLEALWDKPLAEAPREIGKVLRAQQPIGGMSGEVNRTLVKQFRMPGYPLVLVTTDLLQEGEDLHLFCSDVYHYGISWMPSSMEQRIGRIDRVRSQTERRIMSSELEPSGDDLLQVFFPFLRETVEVYQVERVLDRLERFIRLMHENFGTAEEAHDKRINLQEVALQVARSAVRSIEPLRSNFPVKPHLLEGEVTDLAVGPEMYDEILTHFNFLQEALSKRGIRWETKLRPTSRVGHLDKNSRQQAFTILIHTIDEHVTVRCVSPIGNLDLEGRGEEIIRLAKPERVRISATVDSKSNDYRLNAEADVILSRSVEVDLARLVWLIETTTDAADRLEHQLLESDAHVDSFRDDLHEEANVER